MAENEVLVRDAQGLQPGKGLLEPLPSVRYATYLVVQRTDGVESAHDDEVQAGLREVSGHPLRVPEHDAGQKAIGRDRYGSESAEVRLSELPDGRQEVGEFLLEKRLTAGHIEFAQVGDEWV